ncbi:GNAT family N-acetyltransferase [Aquihabitans sp. McL0605]|uniref:GNAT family N-acetyltransferase n=1 Tax=Aquihabitans sp. McL0605 TaxID=3415671 RepID=UPI003CFB69E4
MDPRRLDEIATAATVSPIEADVGGWWCKAAPDLPFRRCNVAVPPVDAAEDRMLFVDGLDQVRRWYHHQGLRLIVQVSTALPEWDLVDAWLEAAGLGFEAPVHLMTAQDVFVCDQCVENARQRVEVATGIDEGWADAYGVVFGGGPVEVARTQAYGRMLTALGDRALGASYRVDGQVVGVGFGVLDDGWLGIFGMGTAPEHRRQGVASHVVHALQEAARQRGVERSYLQVETDNAGAIRLYEELEFVISHGYHYRSEAEPPR